jgi:hypothetical protein
MNLPGAGAGLNPAGTRERLGIVLSVARRSVLIRIVYGPIDYGLGSEVFTLGERVRVPLGLRRGRLTRYGTRLIT